MMVETAGLTRLFGEAVAVDKLDLQIAEGEIFGLLGPNGAGKTTTVRMLAGLIGISAGNAKVAGIDLTDKSQVQNVRRVVGILPEESGLYGELTGAQTLDFFGKLYGMTKAARAERTEMLLNRLGLFERRNEVASTLSKGLKQRLALARALIHDPRLVLLDEPTANLDPAAALVVRDFMLELKAEGRTVIVNTHRLEEAEKVCDRVGILRTRLLKVGTPAALREELTEDRVMFEFERMHPADVEELHKLGVAITRQEASRVEVNLGNSSTSVADIVTALVTNGARITGVVESTASLEEAYLAIVGGAK